MPYVYLTRGHMDGVCLPIKKTQDNRALHKFCIWFWFGDKWSEEKQRKLHFASWDILINQHFCSLSLENLYKTEK